MDCYEPITGRITVRLACFVFIHKLMQIPPTINFCHFVIHIIIGIVVRNVNGGGGDGDEVMMVVIMMMTMKKGTIMITIRRT